MRVSRIPSSSFPIVPYALLLLLVPITSSISLPAGAQSGGPPPITENPIPAPVEKRGLAVEIRDVVRLPRSLGLLPAEQDVNPAGYARVSFVRDAPDGRR
ncbi:MAG: hypothetical protein JXB36_20215, partial [Gammaproteobacteria bacterium]|nr:hypothetical protein [Gammaproteobacteria bacterium]